jgi:cytochrome c oxidase subunit 3
VVQAQTEIRGLRSSIAMTVALVSWAMFFATLFLGYGVFRMTANTWPPMGFERPDLFWPTISTCLILLSSVSYEIYSRKKQESFLSVTVLLGLGFMFGQWQLWSTLKAQGLYVQAGVFPSLLHSFTWIHAAHIVLGLLGLFTLFFVERGKKDEVEKELWKKNIGLFWHFLGVVWLLMLFGIFIF